MSHLLFNLYAEAISQKALEDVGMDIKVRYTDDPIDNVDDLQLVNVIGENSIFIGMKIITRSTKVMTFF